jgi:Zn-finger nucleic acid-binding protein
VGNFPEPQVKLVACPDCHAQYDVTDVHGDTFACRCGKQLRNQPPKAVDAAVRRCSACGAQVQEAEKDCSYCGAAVVRASGPLSLICPECFARNAEASRFCTACGVAFQPEPIPSGGPELACPACELPMKPSRVSGVPVCECTECHGLWVPGENFEQLVHRATEARRAAGGSPQPPRVQGGNPNARAVRYRKCPQCSAFMLRRNFRRSSGVVLDVCRQHGTWLDADEIEEIAGFILSGGEVSTVLEEEHRRAEAEAAAAHRRVVRAENFELTIGYRRGGFGRHRDGPGLLDLLQSILDWTKR